MNTRAQNAFIVAGFCAYLRLCDDAARVKELDLVIDNPPVATRVLERAIILPAYQGLGKFYACNFGDPQEFKLAYTNYGEEIGVYDSLRPSLVTCCYMQRHFEIARGDPSIGVS